MMETTLPFTDGYKVLYHCNGNGCPWNSDSAKNRSKSATRFADSPKTRSSPTQREYDSEEVPHEIVDEAAEMGPSRYLDPDGVRRCRLLDPRVGAHRRGTVSHDAGIALSIIMACSFGTEAISEFGTEDQKERFLEPVATGEKISGAAISEPDTGSDVSSVSTRAEKDGDEWVINGNKMWITKRHRRRLLRRAL